MPGGLFAVLLIHRLEMLIFGRFRPSPQFELSLLSCPQTVFPHHDPSDMGLNFHRRLPCNRVRIHLNVDRWFCVVLGVDVVQLGPNLLLDTCLQQLMLRLAAVA